MNPEEKGKLKERVKAAGVFNNVNTNLTMKHFSPLLIRKYNIIKGWPMYVGIICDCSLSDLDQVINDAVDVFTELGTLDGEIGNDLQAMRNFTGIVSQFIQDHYNTIKKNSVEGIGILLYVDKCAIANMYGDMMNHGQCRAEFYSILNMLPHI